MSTTPSLVHGIARDKYLVLVWKQKDVIVKPCDLLLSGLNS